MYKIQLNILYYKYGHRCLTIKAQTTKQIKRQIKPVGEASSKLIKNTKFLQVGV